MTRNWSVSCENIVSILFLAFANGMNVGFLSFWLNRYDNRFSLSMLSVSAVRDSAPLPNPKTWEQDNDVEHYQIH